MHLSTKRLIWGAAFAVLFCVEAAGQVAPAPLTCQMNAAVTPILRAEGSAERIGDFILVCSGGTPTAAGNPLPQVDITVTLNTNVTSRILDAATGASEALLTVDEPGAPPPEIGSPSIQLACATPLTGCSITSNGGEPYDGTPGRPNVFEGISSGSNSVTFYGVPLTAPGSFGVGAPGSTARVLRITNIRADAAAFWNAVLAYTSGGSLATIQATVSIASSPAIAVTTTSYTGTTSLSPLPPATVIAGFTQFGLAYQTRNAGNTAVAGPVSLSGCVAAIPCGAAVVRFAENFGTAFLTQIGATPQNIPGVVYNSESGFFSSALAASNPNLATAGLADAGTRLKATFQGVPAGAQLWVALNNVGTTSGLSAALTANEAGPLSPVAGLTIGGIPAAQLTVTNGSATAVWEVTGENPAAIDTFDFQVWVVFPSSSSPSGTLTIQGALAPNADGGAFPLAGQGMAQSASFPEPRFTSSAPPSLAIVETHSGNLSQGEAGATFTITVNNTGSATSGAVAVEDLLPSGVLTVTSMTGSGWSCIVEALVCTRSDALAQGESYPPIFLTGNLLANAPAQFLNQLTVSGGGSNAATASDTVSLTVLPQLSSLLPSATFVNSSGFTLAASGANIVSGASIEWTAPGGAQIALPGNFISSAQLQASIPASLLTTPGVAQVAILNPSGASSGSLPFLITNNSQNIPALTSLSPNHTAQNSSPFTLTANGSSFQAGASIAWTTTDGTSVNLPASFVGAAQVQATVPANLLTTAGTAQVAILNPGFGLTAQQAFLITGVNPSQQPQLTSIDPNTVLKNSAAFTVTANGSNFQAGASVWWTAPTGTTVTLPASFINSAQVQVTVPANLLTTPGTAQVAVLNPGSLLSASQSLAITTSGPSVQPLSVTPAAGAGASQVFSMQYLDTAGVADLSTVWVWFNANLNTVSSANSCLVYYARATNQIFLLNDAGTVWSPAAPGAATGAVMLSNSQCAINAGGASISASGTNLTVSLPVTFAAEFAGTKNIYLFAAGSGVNNGWQPMGTWTVPAGSAPASPVLSIASVHSGNFLQGQTGATYTVTVSNQSGAPATSGLVTVTDTPSNGLTVTSMTGTGWVCSGNACTRSDSLLAGASYPAITVTVNVGAAAGTPQVNSVSVSGGGAATANATDSTAILTGSTPVSAVSVVPNNGSGASQTFALHYSDTAGATDLSALWVWFTSDFDTAHAAYSCLAYYARAANQLFLVNDAGSGTLGPLTLGGGTPLSNSQCTIGVEAASVTASGTDLILNLPVTFTTSYPGAKGIYLYAAGASANSGWQSLGAWSVPAAQPALTVSSAHSGVFTQGQDGALYTVTVSNTGTGISPGLVSVVESLPAGLSLVSMSGSGWTCSGASCSTSNTLAIGASYPPIAVAVNVAVNATSPQTNSVSVSGGGSAAITATDSTTIVPPTTISLASTPNPSTFGRAVTLTATVSPSSATGLVTFYDGVAVLGTGRLSGGQAALTTSLLASGGRSLHAHYSGDGAHGASNSTPVSQDVTAVSAAALLPAVSYAAVYGSSAVATGDFNGDGKTDLAIASPNSGYVRILLGNGDGTFAVWDDYYSQYGEPIIAAGDFNGDGKADLAVGSTFSDSVAIMLGNGDGTFQAAQFISLGNAYGIAGMVAADFNGDGKVDLAAVAYESGLLVVVLGNGDGSFQPPVSYGVGNGPISLAVADFNGDGKPDLVVASPVEAGVLVFLGNGDGTFAPSVTYAAGGSAQYVASVTTGDFNGDGKQDIATASAGVVAMLLGNGDGTFQPAVTYQGSQIPLAAIAADFNGDGFLDLAVTDGTSGTVNVLAGRGDGSFTEPYAAYNSGGSNPSFLAVGDFNGDGRTDLAVANSGSYNFNGSSLGGNNVSVLLGAASGISCSPSSFNITAPVNGPAISTTCSALTVPAGITVSAAPGSGGWLSVQPTSFTSPSTLTVTANPGSLLAGVYVGVVFLTGGGSTIPVPVTLTVVNAPALSITATQAGSFTQGQTGAKSIVTVSNQAPNSQTSGVVTVTETVSGGLTLVSMSGSGWTCSGNTCTRNDALAGGSSYPAITVTLNVAGGASSPQVNSATVSGGGSPSAGITNSTVILSAAAVSLASATNPSVFGQAVTLTATVTPSAATGKVTFYEGTTVLGTSPLSSGVASLSTILLPAGSGTLRAYYGGDGSHGSSVSNLVSQSVNANAGGAFTAGQPPLVANGPMSVAVADFNGDGKADIAVAANGGGVNILLGDGLGNFRTAGSFPAGSGLWSLAVGDFNGDGKVDVAAANLGSVSILLGNGDGTLQPPVNYLVPLPFSIVVADFNGDGKADLAVGSLSSSLSILLGNGDGTFQAPVNVALSQPTSLAAGDFNGDGNTDLAAVNDEGLAVMLGNGDGTFQSPVNYAVDATAVAVGDFNGDGKADLAVTFGLANTVSILLGNGDGTFRAGSTYLAGTYPVCLTVGDFNGDGKADLAVGNQSSSDVSLLLGNGDGTFQRTANYPVGSQPQSIIAGDFNGDGRADLASGTSEYAAVGILLGALPPVLSVSSTHTGNFTQGQSGATYTITVTNQGVTATNGTVTVTETIPAGLSLVSMTGTGWTCIGNTCTRSDVLNVSSSYPAITATANVGASASSPQVNSVSVSGGGSATASATDSTVIQAAGTAPATVSVSPSSGSGAQQTFALHYADPLGATDLTTVWVWFTSNFNAATSANSCLVYYARAANQLFLLNDAGTVWSPATPGVTAGPAVTLSNSQCSINARAASVTSSGTDLILNLPVTFTVAYAGVKSTYMYAAGSSANSGWQTMGSWTVPPPAPVLSVASTHSGSFTQGQIGATYTVTVANQAGAAATSGTVAVTDALPGGLTFSSMTGPGWVCTSNTCTRSDGLNAGASYPAITVTVYVGASASSPQVNSVSVWGGGSAAASATDSTIIQAAGTVPATVSVTPSSGTGLQQTFALHYADPLGATDLTTAWVWFTSNFNAATSANSCLLYYARAANQLFLLNDAGTTYSSAAPGVTTAGAAVTLSNSQCSINVAAASVTSSGTGLTLNLPVTFTTAYAGAKITYMYAAGSVANSGWQAMGSWTVPSPGPSLSVASVHSGNFTQGQIGATYTVTVANQGTTATNGTVTVTDTLPAGLTLTSMTGTGWICTGNTCTRVDVLNVGASYPAITVTVNVGGSASSPQVNSVSVSGGGSATASATDSTIVQVPSPPPTTVSVTPSSGSGLQQTFALHYADPLGAADLTTVWVWFTSNFSTATSANSCLVYYSGATNGLFLLNDAATVWLPAAPEQAVTLSNSRCSINAGAASVTSSGTDLTLNLPVTFTTAYAGAKNTYMYAAGSSANSGWQAMGSWTVPAPSPVLSVGSAHTGNFTQGQVGATYTLTVSNQTGTGATSGTVTVTDTLPAGLTLTSMTGTGWICTSNTCTRSDALNVGASYPAITVTVNVAASASSPQANSASVSGGGSSLTDSSTDSTIVQAAGTAPATVSATPSSGLGLHQTFALHYADPLGAADLTTVGVWFTSNTASAANSCQVYYTVATGQFSLFEGVWSPTPPGSAFGNSQCSIGTAATATASGTDLTLNLPVTFTQAYAGTKTIYMYAAGSVANTGWQPMGSWTVPAGPPPMLSVALAHSGSFTLGQTGATYTVTVSNQTGAAATSGAVAVTDTLPSGLTLTSMTGTGWTCTGATCSRSDVLNAGASYPAIAVIVSVGPSASSPQVNSVSVSGGGSANAGAIDSTVIQGASTAPTTVSVDATPGSGAAVWFSLDYGDPLGATDLATVWVWFTSNFNTSSSANSCLVYYARATNQIFLLNDAGTVWSPATPGGILGLGNSQCFVNVAEAEASAEATGTDLFVSLPVTFAAGYAGAKTIYMYAAGSGGNSGWQPMGSWTVPAAPPPAPVLSVASTHIGSFTQGQTGATYTVTVSNQTGAAATSGTVAVTDTLPAGLTLTSMTGAGWTCTGATCSRSDVLNAAASYPAITVTVNVGASAASPQVNSVSVSGGGSATASATDSTIIQAASTAPTTVSVTPSSGSGAQQTFALQYDDPLGATDLTTAWVWFTSNFNAVSSANSCLVYYARATNQVFLLNDAGTAYSSATPGAAVTLSNSQCSVNAAAASVTASGTSLTVNLPVTFAAGYAGTKSIYMYAAGSNANSGWQTMGIWTVP